MGGRELERQHVSIGSGDTTSSNGTLCHKCLAISWKPEESGHRQVARDFYRWPLDHHETFSDLKASCEGGCPLCQTFFLLLTYDGLVSVGSDPLHWNVEYNRGRWEFHFDTQKFHHIEPWYMYKVGKPGRHIPSPSITMVKGNITDHPFNNNTNEVPQASHRQVWQMIYMLSSRRASNHGLKPVYAPGYIRNVQTCRRTKRRHTACQLG